MLQNIDRKGYDIVTGIPLRLNLTLTDTLYKNALPIGKTSQPRSLQRLALHMAPIGSNCLPLKICTLLLRIGNRQEGRCHLTAVSTAPTILSWRNR